MGPWTGTGANRSETETASVQHRSELDRRRMALCASYLVATSASERSSASRFLRKYTWRRIIATVSPCSSVISTSNQCRYLSPLAVLERKISTLVRCRDRSEEHTSELQSRFDVVCRLLLDKKKRIRTH